MRPTGAGDARRRRGGAAAGARGDRRHRLRLEPHALGHPGLQDLAQVREPAVHRLLQGARRAQPPVHACRPRRRSRASSPCRPAITPRASPIMRSACRIPATIVMPVNTPTVKVDQHAPARRRGDPDAARRWRRRRLRARAWTRARPHLHPPLRRSPRDRRAGHARAWRCWARRPRSTRFVVPIGGGGLISGIAVAAKALKPGVRVIGVQAALYPSMYNAVKGDRPADARRYAGRGHRRQGAGPHHAGDRRAISSTTSCW